MINKQIIRSIYHRYRKRPESPDCLDIPLLFDSVSKYHKIAFEMDGFEDSIVINSIGLDSPFHRIALARIHAIIPFKEWVAIVLHSSIIFLSRNSNKVGIHLRLDNPNRMDCAELSCDTK